MTTEPDPLPAGPPPPRGRAAWLGHLLLLTAWILILFATALARGASAHGYHPMANVPGMLWRHARQATLFGLVCGAAWLCSRATASQWRLRWKGGLGPIWRGFLYSVAARLALLVLGIGLALILEALHLLDAHTVSHIRPRIENAVSLQAMSNDPLFAWIGIPLISGYAGVAEEIWRGGMLAGFAGAFPALFADRHGQKIAVVPTALLFGLAHLYMGWLTVAFAFLFGLVLGVICVRRETIWDAVFTHGFFDATSLITGVWLLRHFPHLPGHG